MKPNETHETAYERLSEALDETLPRLTNLERIAIRSKVETVCAKCGSVEACECAMTETPTPLTDAEVLRLVLDCEDSCCPIYVKLDGKEIDAHLVTADFARQLERDRAELIAALAGLLENYKSNGGKGLGIGPLSIARATLAKMNPN